jgi:hypothetical protein
MYLILPLYIKNNNDELTLFNYTKYIDNITSIQNTITK